MAAFKKDLEPKLDYKQHFNKLSDKILSKRNLINKVKSLILIRFIFKSCIASIFDCAFIILNASTQRIDRKLQKLQKRLLKQVKYFPPGTTTDQIHENFKIIKINVRMEKY